MGGKIVVIKYSDIVGEIYYNIGLSKHEACLVDAHFAAAAHHRGGALLADDLRNGQFHQKLYWLHLKRLFEIVSMGDFSHAKDLSGRGMNLRGSWHTSRLPECVSVLTDLDKSALPHENMFGTTSFDGRLEMGDDHPYDILLSGKPLNLAQIDVAAWDRLAA